MKYLTNVKYWETVQGEPNLKLNDGNLIKKWIDAELDFSNIDNCIEIGCYPGRYLSIFAEKGIEVNGLDYVKSIKELPYIFESNGYRVGDFHYGDFLKVNIERKFDCVFSLGFIEHFQDWEEIFIKHLDLVGPNGILIIEVPNFTGWLQYVPRFLFDLENLKRHNLQAMDLQKWRKILDSRGFEVTFSGYLGGYLLWFERNKQNRFMNIFIKCLKKLKRKIFGELSEHRSFSAAMGIIARRK